MLSKIKVYISHKGEIFQEAQGYTKTESKTKIVYNFGDSPMKKSQVSLKTDTTKNHGSPVNNKPKVLHYFGEAPSKVTFFSSSHYLIE